MKFPKILLQDLAWGGAEGYDVVENRIVGTSRWATEWVMVFKTPEGSFFRTCYSRGATEMQDEQPFQYDADEIECVQVYPTLVARTEYVERIP